MTKVFDFHGRSAELIAQGVTDEEAVAIMEREEADADFTILDDRALWSELAESFADVEVEVESELASEGISQT